MSSELAIIGLKDWNYSGLPAHIRFYREPFSFGEIEIEFLKKGERQGRIFDVDYMAVLDWLRLRGIQITDTLERAYDAAWNFGDVTYFVEEDHFLIL